MDTETATVLPAKTPAGASKTARTLCGVLFVRIGLMIILRAH